GLTVSQATVSKYMVRPRRPPSQAWRTFLKNHTADLIALRPIGISGRHNRNGYRRGRLSTAEGAIEYGVPQVADRPEPFVSRVRAGLAGRTAELERLAVEMFARGLSTRDIEAAFRDATGASTLSRSAVSQVTERLWQEYEAFATRDLREFAVAYFFVDGVAERLHAGL